jgi:hypothetical protein
LCCNQSHGEERKRSCEGDPFDLSDTFLTDKEYVGDSTKSSDKASQQYSPWREVNHLSLSGIRWPSFSHQDVIFKVVALWLLTGVL